MAVCQFVAFQPEKAPLSRRTVDAMSSFAANAFGGVEHAQNRRHVAGSGRLRRKQQQRRFVRCR
jgi:hypothetical protein